MYGLLKGYVSRKATNADDSDVDEDVKRGDFETRPQQSLQVRKDSSDPASYGRFLSWGIDGVSYLGSQLKSRVDRSLSWWTEPDIESELGEKQFNMASTKRSGPRQPEGTVTYTVAGSDTLNKIALVFDTTPSELTRMNKLTSRMLYPGQLLFVPDKSKAVKAPTVQQKIIHTDDRKPKPQGHVHMPHGHHGHHGHRGHHETIKLTKTVSLTSDDEEEISESFLKIKSKHITDGQGVVNGVILITPHSVIFHPNVSDPLVMDRGRDKYCIKTPMSAITSAALYKDIAAMAIHDPLKSGRFYLDESTKESVSRQNSVDVEHSKSSQGLHSANENTSKQTNITQENEKNTANGLKEPQPSLILNRDGKTNSEHEQLVAIANEILQDMISDIVTNVCNEQNPKNIECNKMEQTSVEQNAISLSPLSEDSGICSPKNKGTLSKGADSSSQNKDQGNSGAGNDKGSVVHTNKGLSDSGDHNTSRDSVLEGKATTSEKRHSSFLENLSGDVKYWLGVSYKNEDDHAFEEEIIPRPAAAYEDNLVYLCLRISKQHWCMCLAGVGEHCHKEERNVMNRDKQRREHWFAIPASRIEHVYSFINRCCPNIKRTLSISEDDDDDQLLDVDDDDDEEEGIQYVDGFYSCTPPKPQVTMTTETKQQQMTLEINRPSSCNTKESVITPDLSDDLMFMPEMSTESQILTPTHIKKLNKNLPSRAVGHGWTLVYSTFTHGFSLKTLYRNMEEYDTPMLIVIQDDEHQIFGVVTSCPLRISEHFYGNGQCFLFKFKGENIKTYSWTGDNDFFMKGSVDCVAFGGGGGHFGLWLDEDFYHGSSHHSETYKNDTLSTNEDFLCSALEAWTFM